MVERLPEALHSNPSTAKKFKKKEFPKVANPTFFISPCACSMNT
jgi:hypothetical protein